MTNFLGHLPEAKFDASKVELNQTTYLVGDQVIFIRECFPRLYETVKNRVLDGKFISLTGTPGLGKSMFAYYVALRLLHEKNVAVIFIHMGWQETHLFLPNNVPDRVKAVLAKYGPPEKEVGWVGRLLGTPSGLQFDTDISAKKLYQDLTCLVGDVVVILDPPRDFGEAVFQPPSTGLFIATSPRPVRSTSADVQGGLVEIYFPLWTLEEIRRLVRERSQRELTPKELGELEYRFLLFGGVPRWIVKPNISHDEMVFTALQKTKNAISRVSSATLKEMFDPRSSQPDVSGLLIHLKVVNAEFTETKKKFASAMVELELYRRGYDTGRAELRHFLSAARDIEGFKQAAGNLYESSWHVILQHGAEVELEELFDRSNGRGPYPPNSKKQKITLPSTSSRYSARQNLDDVRDLLPKENELGTYLHILATNVPSVDAITVVPMSVAGTIFGSTTSNVGSGASGSSRALKRRKHAAESMPLSTKAEWCMIAYQHAISVKDKLNVEGCTNVMNLSERACGPSPSCVHFVFVTTPSRAAQYHFVKVEAEPRFKKVRQWLLTVSDDLISAFSTSSD
jgi:hypothetical protein